VGVRRLKNPVVVLIQPSMLRALLVLGLAIGPLGCGDFVGFDDDGPLVVEAVSPVSGASDVSVLSPISVRFSAPIAMSSVSAAVSLRSGGRPFYLVSSFPHDRTLVLTPTDPLDFGTDFDLRITQALTSRSGGILAEEASWSFRTEGLPPPVPSMDSLRTHLEDLSHDSMAGRGSGTEDERRAAEYLRDRLLSYGLQEAPGGAFQGFEALDRGSGSPLASQNVLAAVEGSGALAGEWIVVGAHYDHVGVREVAEGVLAIHNGADDNGSGTVTILEIARLLQAYVNQAGTASRNRRSVLFAAFGGEEAGLLGSCHYVHEAPVVPLAMTRAMMNFDMVGRLRSNTVYLSGFETSPAWQPLASDANSPSLLISVRQSCTGCTDHACFWQAGIPFIGFFTGFHDEYHQPEDDVEFIDFQGMSRIAELGLRALIRLMVVPETPPFVG
jgi:hypothetical protein